MGSPYSQESKPTPSESSKRNNRFRFPFSLSAFFNELVVQVITQLRNGSGGKGRGFVRTMCNSVRSVFWAQEPVQRRERRESGCTNAEASKTGDIYGFAMVSLTPKSAESGASINSSSPTVGEINVRELWKGLNEMIGVYCPVSAHSLSPMDAQPVVLVTIYCHNFVTNVTQVRDVTVS
jgi:hypothetical protein